MGESERALGLLTGSLIILSVIAAALLVPSYEVRAQSSPAPSISLNPSGGPIDSTVIVDGHNFASNTVYFLCLNPDYPIAPCYLQLVTFTTSSNGSIPYGTTFIVPGVSRFGNWYVSVYSGPSVVVWTNFYVQALFTLTFVETGLPDGTPWNITMGLRSDIPISTMSSTGNSITAKVTAGSYFWWFPFFPTTSPRTRFFPSANGVSITVSNDTLVAINFTKEYHVTASAMPSEGGAVSPADTWGRQGLSIPIKAVASVGYQFVSWQGSSDGSYSGPNATASVVLGGPILEIANFVMATTTTSSGTASTITSTASSAGAATKGFATVRLPSSWSQVTALYASDGLVFIGGEKSSNQAAFGMYSTDQQSFDDLSNFLPSYYGATNAISYGDGTVLIGGHYPNGAWLGAYKTSNQSFIDLTRPLNNAVRATLSVNAIGWDGQNFLVGGATNGDSLLGFYSPGNKTFDALTSYLPYYFAINTMAWNGQRFLVAGAKAGPGGSPSTPPALGYVFPSGHFLDLSGIIPSSLGVMGRVGFDGSVFLIAGQNANTGGLMVQLFNPSTIGFTDITNKLPVGLTIDTVLGGAGWFLVGGQISGNAYALIYNEETNSQTNISSTIATGVESISSSAVAPNGLFVGGIHSGGGAFLAHSTMIIPSVSSLATSVAPVVTSAVSIGSQTSSEQSIPIVGSSYSAVEVGLVSGAIAGIVALVFTYLKRRRNGKADETQIY